MGILARKPAFADFSEEVRVQPIPHLGKKWWEYRGLRAGLRPTLLVAATCFNYPWFQQVGPRR